MHKADHTLGAPGVVGNGSRRGLTRAAPAVPVSTRGYVSVRASAHSDPGNGTPMGRLPSGFCALRGRKPIASHSTWSDQPEGSLADRRHPRGRAIAARDANRLVVAA
jgi:hypothetical protein